MPSEPIDPIMMEENTRQPTDPDLDESQPDTSESGISASPDAVANRSEPGETETGRLGGRGSGRFADGDSDQRPIPLRAEKEQRESGRADSGGPESEFQAGNAGPSTAVSDLEEEDPAEAPLEVTQQRDFRSVVTILHISDLHFGPPYVPPVGEALQEVAHHLQPDVIVVSGDLTQRATREQFEDAKVYLDRLPDVPKVVVPGNHDVPLFRLRERVLDPHGLFREIIRRDMDHVLKVDGATLVALDSTDPYGAITNGKITNEQLAFCEEAFRDTPSSDARIVVAHHHFAPAPDYEPDRVMKKAKRAMERFLGIEVDLILGGHLHRAYIGNSLDIYPGKPHRHRHQGIIIAQCGTSTSRRGRARERMKNSFNIIRIGKNMLHITHNIYFDDTSTFSPISRHLFPRPGSRFITAGEDVPH